MTKMHPLVGPCEHIAHICWVPVYMCAILLLASLSLSLYIYIYSQSLIKIFSYSEQPKSSINVLFRYTFINIFLKGIFFDEKNIYEERIQENILYNEEWFWLSVVTNEYSQCSKGRAFKAVCSIYIFTLAFSVLLQLMPL